jgi:hypothetical protein
MCETGTGQQVSQFHVSLMMMMMMMMIMMMIMMITNCGSEYDTRPVE